MNTPIIALPRWSTASFGDSADTSPVELSALGAHLAVCQDSNARLRAMQRLTHTLHRFVAARFVSSLVVLALLVLAASLFL